MTIPAPSLRTKPSLLSSNGQEALKTNPLDGNRNEIILRGRVGVVLRRECFHPAKPIKGNGIDARFTAACYLKTHRVGL